jgi:hypothetical protein
MPTHRLRRLLVSLALIAATLVAASTLDLIWDVGHANVAVADLIWDGSGSHTKAAPADLIWD